MIRLIAVAALCLSLGACNMYNQPGTSASVFDGSYQGTMSALHAGANSCASTAAVPGTLAVERGNVVWKASSALTLYAPVAQDGSFTAQNGSIFMSGKITNRAMIARINTGSCHQIYDLTKNA